MNWIFAHLIGDYLLQNDWMARNKKTSSFACSVHIITYMIPFLFIGLEVWQLLAIAGQHWIQDRTNFVLWFMKVTGKNDFIKPPMAPWSIIVIDNIFHILWIALVIYTLPGWIPL